jgi:hypothetical protein
MANCPDFTIEGGVARLALDREAVGNAIDIPISRARELWLLRFLSGLLQGQDLTLHRRSAMAEEAASLGLLFVSCGGRKALPEKAS